MNTQAPHYDACMAAIGKIVELQAMGAEFREKLNEAIQYAEKMKAHMNDSVFPAMHAAAGDSPRPLPAEALGVLYTIRDQAIDIDTSGKLLSLRDDILERDIIGASFLPVSNMESYAFQI